MVGKNTQTCEMITDNIIKGRKMDDTGVCVKAGQGIRSHMSKASGKALDLICSPKKQTLMWRFICRKCVGSPCLLRILFKGFVERRR